MTAEMSQTKRLRRLETIFVSSPVYFVTACISRRREVLAQAAMHGAFIDFANDGPKHGAWIGKYALMPDHLRITLAKWMKSLKNTLSKVMRAQRIAAPHWQKTFFDHVLRSSESYSANWEYVAANPVRAGLVARPEKWPFQGEIFHLESRPDKHRRS
jgi:putative transposase